MDYREVATDREFVARLEYGRDWREQIETFAAEEDIESGFFTGLGAVQDAEFYFYDQEKKEYYPEWFDEPLEVAACVGNVSWLEGERFAHTHAVCSREDGTAFAGHLNAGTTFAGELYIHAFDDRFVRERDETTELDLWPL